MGLILSCPPAGPTTANKSLFSDSRHGENFVFHFRTRRPRSLRGRLEGWPRARSRSWPSFETRASFDKLRSALLRTRLMDDIDMIRTLETLLYLAGRMFWFMRNRLSGS